MIARQAAPNVSMAGIRDDNICLASQFCSLQLNRVDFHDCTTSINLLQPLANCSGSFAIIMIPIRGVYRSVGLTSSPLNSGRLSSSTPLSKDKRIPRWSQRRVSDTRTGQHQPLKRTSYTRPASTVPIRSVPTTSPPSPAMSGVLYPSDRTPSTASSTA